MYESARSDYKKFSSELKKIMSTFSAQPKMWKQNQLHRKHEILYIAFL